MKKTLLTSFALLLTAVSAAAQTDGMFCYIYDDAAQTATVTYQRNKDGAMEGGTYYGDVVIPAKAPNGYAVTTIGEYAFYRSNKMTSLTIPATVDSIGRTPFEGCNASLKKIVVEDSEKPLRCFVLDAWPRGCFPVFGRDVQVEGLYMGRLYESYVSRSAVEVVYDGTWSLVRDSEYLKTFTMGKVYTEVPEGMFYGCTQLRTVSLSPNVTSIGKDAFCKCESLESIALPDNVEIIGEYAFQLCKSLKSINLPQSLRIISAYAFHRCNQFGQFTIPASVDSIGISILDDCVNLKRIDIAYSPNPLKYTCPSQFNNSLRSAPIDTLYMDRYIVGAFSDNRTVKKLYVGPNVTSIINEIFSNCYNIDEVYSLNPVPPVCEGSSVFYSGTKEKGCLHVPDGSVDAYKAAFCWKDFFNIDAASVAGTKKDAASVAESYTLSGQRASNTHRGLTIQRLSDGTTRKTFSDR